MGKLILSIFILLFLTACAEKPDGVFVMNEETIENFFEKDKQSWNPPQHLNLLLNQPVVQASLPQLPPNLTRLYGTLDSNGPYVFKNTNIEIKNRGSSFKNSKFGMLGPAGNAGNAWFYIDFNPVNGEIADARAYLYGFMGGVCDMREKTRGTYGKIGEKDFYLNINGPCLFPQISGSTMNYALFVQGQSRPILSPQGGLSSVNYIIDNSGAILDIPANPETSANIYDAGHGQAWTNQ